MEAFFNISGFESIFSYSISPPQILQSLLHPSVHHLASLVTLSTGECAVRCLSAGVLLALRGDDCRGSQDPTPISNLTVLSVSEVKGGQQPLSLNFFLS